MSDPRPFSLDPALVPFLQRAKHDPFASARSGKATVAPPARRRQVHVRGVSAQKKTADEAAGPDPQIRPLERLLVGLFGARVPFAFQVDGTPASVRFLLSVWTSEAAATPTPTDVGRHQDVLVSLLRGVYPSVDIDDSAPSPPVAWPNSGVALGVPSLLAFDPADPALPMQRLVRALTGHTWSLLILGQPASPDLTDQMRDKILNDMRLASAAQAASTVSSPLADYYHELLDAQLKAITTGESVGMWRTAVYLLGDERSYPALSSTFRGVFSGSESLPEPVRTFDGPEAARWAARWAMPDDRGPEGPAGFVQPYAAQTVLSSRQLAALVHLPNREIPGFQIKEEPAFDTETVPDVSEAQVQLGNVMHGTHHTQNTYAMDANRLTRHAFVTGVTGSGKTNTIMQLLLQLHAKGIPFLVVEPAKREYRELLKKEFVGQDVLVLTPGNENISSFRLNPFEVTAGTSVAEHLDLLKAAFSAGFGMWTPLPQVLERCLHAIYEDKGWDLLSGANARLGPGESSSDAFPTLTDLVRKVAEVVPTLGYEEKVTGDIRAALETRLESLRRGGKGAMLDVPASFPFDAILNRPAILELEGVADDDDKALLMALILIRLVEHRRSLGGFGTLKHLLVIEEAHRLLSAVPPRAREEDADPKGKAVETFANLLSEVRAYGQGILIADQIPVRLAPDAVKNTGLKIAHRIVAGDDRSMLATMMAMNEEQSRAFTTLLVGKAAVFCEGDDLPILVAVPPVKAARGAIDDEAVAAHMTAWRKETFSWNVLAPRPFCAETCSDNPDACRWARRVADDPGVKMAFSRTVLSTMEDAAALDRLWDDLVSTLTARRLPGVSGAASLRAFAGHATESFAQRRGSQAGWSYASATEFSDLLRAALLEKIDGAASSNGQPRYRLAFVALAERLHARAFAPYWACDAICQQATPLCVYRSAVADLVASGRYQRAWIDTDGMDSSSPDQRRARTWSLCQDAAYELIEFPERGYPEELTEQLAAAARRTAFCFEQQMLASDLRKLPLTSRRIITHVMIEAGVGSQLEKASDPHGGRAKE
jgi:hypothetical protein